MSRFDIEGRIALVTGSYRGIGEILAQGLANAGAAVVINGRSPDGVAEAVERFRSDGHTASGYPFDITNAAEVSETVAEIEKEVGPIDILVNNAGIQYRAALHDVDADNWRKVVDINLTGAFLVGKEVAKGMMKRRGGKIINVCSLASDAGRKNIGPYTASKGGLKMLTKAMCADWAAYNVQINGIAPGYFKTELTKALVENKEFNDYVVNRTPAGRWGDPEELVGTLVLLSSQASDFINGQVIVIDGGILATM